MPDATFQATVCTGRRQRKGSGVIPRPLLLGSTSPGDWRPSCLFTRVVNRRNRALRRTTQALALGVVLACARTVVAEPERRGLLFGIELGVGREVPSCCQSRATGTAAGIRIGGSLTDRLALALDFSSIMPTQLAEGDPDSHDVWAVVAQYWPASMVWVKGGLGRASQHKRNGPAAVGAVGIEIGQGDAFAFDFGLRIVPARYEGMTLTNVTLAFGLNWY
jgi:hypothetical protein